MTFFSALGIVLDAGAAAGREYSVLFYPGSNDNQEICILPPGSIEPLNPTRHPARDLCPAAAPNGKTVASLSDRGGSNDREITGVETKALAAANPEQHGKQSNRRTK